MLFYTGDYHTALQNEVKGQTMSDIATSSADERAAEAPEGPRRRARQPQIVIQDDSVSSSEAEDDDPAP